MTQQGLEGDATLNRKKKNCGGSFGTDCNKAILLPVVCSALKHVVSAVIHCSQPSESLKPFSVRQNLTGSFSFCLALQIAGYGSLVSIFDSLDSDRPLFQNGSLTQRHPHSDGCLAIAIYVYRNRAT